MLDRQTSPLEIAERVLSVETMQYIENANLSLTAQKILDRWALNAPDLLRELEQEGVETLIQQIHDAAQQEKDILHSESAKRAREYGMCDMEIMQEMGPPSFFYADDE